MLKKLRLRFIGVNMAIVAGMLLIIFGLIFSFTMDDLDTKSDAMLQSLVQSSRDPVGHGRGIQLPYLIIQVNTWGEITIIGKTDHDITNADFIEELIQIVYTGNKTMGYIEKYEMKYAVESGLGVQKLFFLDISSQHSTLVSLIHISILTGIIALGIFFLISILLARWAVKPVGQAWQQQKQFISDASHELKTPLTVVLSNAELLQDPDIGNEDIQRYTSNIMSGAQQMRRLTEDMLELARADNGQIQTSFQDLDLSALLSSSILPFEPILFENGMLLEATVEPGICLNGSAQHLQQLIDILLDNARKYSSPGIIQIRLSKQNGNQCLLSVASPGNPIPKDALKKIFQRFYRVDEARNDKKGFGLGLSIAQRIVQEHKGTIWAESNETGNQFNVLLPCK